MSTGSADNLSKDSRENSFDGSINNLSADFCVLDIRDYNRNQNSGDCSRESMSLCSAASPSAIDFRTLRDGSVSMSLCSSLVSPPRDYSLFSLSLNTSMSSQVEHFRCEGHAEHSLTCMKNYLQAGKLCDVTLIAGTNGKRVQAHRYIFNLTFFTFCRNCA